MIGWVPKVLVGFLDQIAGESTRRTILADAGLDPEGTEFRLDRDVPDPACRKVIEAACARLGVTEAQAFALFAPYFLGAARAAFPGFFRKAAGTRAFLLGQPAIHNCLAAGLRDPQRRAVADKFRVEATPGGVRVFYNSPNRLAALYVAVAHELAKSYGEVVKTGFEAGSPENEKCTISVELAPVAATTLELAAVAA